jgi:O-antigen/teichoic acid export membrane protein
MLMVVSIVSGMVFSRTLSVADYGTYLQTFLAYDFAVPILTLGLPSAMYYFLPGAKNRQKGLVLDNITLLFVSAIIFSFFLALGGAELLAKRFNNPDLLRTLNWMIYYPIYTFPVLIESAVWVVKDKIKLNAIYNVFSGLFLTILLILAAFLTKSYNTPILIRVFIPLLFFPLTIYLIFKHVPGDWDIPRITSMWSMVKFSIPLGLASVIGTITIQLSSMIVALMTSPSDFAIYANGAKEVPLIGIVTGSISIVIMAEMAHKIKEGDLNSALELFRKAATVSASFLIPIMIFLMIYAESFIDILYSSKYTASVIPFRIYLFAIPIRIVYYSAAFIAFGKSKTILFRSMIDLCLTAILSYFFVSWFGINGAPVGLILTMFIWTVPYNLYSLGKDFNCKSHYIIPFAKVGKIFIISILAGLISAFFLIFNLPSTLLFIFGFIVFFIVYSSFAFHYISDFKELIAPYFKKNIYY